MAKKREAEKKPSFTQAWPNRNEGFPLFFSSTDKRKPGQKKTSPLGLLKF